MAKSSIEKYFEGIGRRKTSTARVRIYNSAGVSIVNGKPLEQYFVQNEHKANIVRPLIVVGMLEKFHFSVVISGGGITGQSDAIKLGLARALVKFDETLKSQLRNEGLLTRDPRMVERKKYGLKKARKKPQFSKR